MFIFYLHRSSLFIVHVSQRGLSELCFRKISIFSFYSIFTFYISYTLYIFLYFYHRHHIGRDIALSSSLSGVRSYTVSPPFQGLIQENIDFSIYFTHILLYHKTQKNQTEIVFQHYRPIDTNVRYDYYTDYYTRSGYTYLLY